MRKMDMNHTHEEIIKTHNKKDCQGVSEKIKLQALEFEFYCMNSSSDKILKKSLHQMISLCKNALEDFDTQQKNKYQKVLNQRKDDLVSKLLKKK